jgi:hypothetical protein
MLGQVVRQNHNIHEEITTTFIIVFLKKSLKKLREDDKLNGPSDPFKSYSSAV